MRIAYLINQYPKVSHTFIRREILALERQGVEVVRVALRGWDAELVDVKDRSERERTHYVLREGAPKLLLSALRLLLTSPVVFFRALALACHMGRRADRPLPVHLVYFVEACWLTIWLRATEVEHVHAHFGTNSAEVAMLVHELGGPSWSFTAHGPEEFDKRELIGLAEKVGRCAFAVVISSYGRSQLYRIVDSAQWPKIQLVRCGLEPAFHVSAGSPVPTGNRLVCVGRLCEQKGQLLLMEAAYLLKAKQDFELVLVGDGEMRSIIEATIARHDLQSYVRITGWISSDQVRDEILAARALVLPSFAEGLPVVLMEAMALERPVISTFVGGIPELVQPGEHGWLVPAGEVESLMLAMQACLDAPSNKLADMGKSGQKNVLARHNVDTSASQLKALFSGTACEP